MQSDEPLTIKRTNFQGSWSDTCPHCDKPQLDHRITYGPYNGIIHEHRMPCNSEKDAMIRKARHLARIGKIIVLVVWILVPLAYLLLQQFVAIIGWVVFGAGIFALLIKTIKCFGNPDRWIPGHKKKREKELRDRHFIYHCERNPEGFERLRAENFMRESEKS